MWNGKKVLVTGGGGFLGSSLINRLIDLGVADIRSVGRSPQPSLERLGVECLLGDIAEPTVVDDACGSRDFVFHVAAKAGVWGAREEFRNANVAGTANVIAACGKHSVPVLVNTSSPSVVFSKRDLENADETLPYPAKYPAWYPATKAEAERMVMRAATKDLRTISLRPHLLWGVGDNHILPRLARRAAVGRLKRVGSGENKVDMTHVSNAVQAHILAAEVLSKDDSCSGKVYFISDGAPVNLWKWIDDFISRMGFPLVSSAVSFRTAYAVGAGLECLHTVCGIKKEPLMTRFVAAELAHSHFFDISAAKRDLGYSPSVDADKALDEAVEWLKERMALPL
ncbi:MAG: NAD-dependent epimerase/dehydratase family protein [Kiritimatiellaeota bacterium]|nr:NAD-dependent epimerase/dehydratase family protein [Kiritimatiellota bacterium]